MAGTGGRFPRPVKKFIDALRGGSATVQALQSEFDASLDLGNVTLSGGSLTLTGSYQSMASFASAYPCILASVWVYTASAFGGGEVIDFKVTTTGIDGTKRTIWYEQISAAPGVDAYGLPSNDSDSAVENLPKPIYLPAGTHTVEVYQSAVGGGYITVAFQVLAARRGA